ncbi:SDR family NAD(P)-dependent oxidoreductase [Streptomyces sp. AJS327]|uniref:SDR family NAD(P)-dependent oxidoreductase n=1 Tax=Streptomyces sp. AJS327 TaxID=2545265 RepID=UPI0015DD62B2|nr:SDR family NAD(P)-dependent oxidoreductase [Streptomyces sp. AJS327]MBA0052409.1 SDR family NAD(P)-dependent oxidoreductase [Streptomyces sp. AJS327]
MTPPPDGATHVRALLERYQRGELDRATVRAELRAYRGEFGADTAGADASEAAGDAPERAAALLARVREALAGLRPDLPPLTPDTDTTPYTALGLTSADLVGLNNRLEEDLRAPLSPTVFFDHPSPRATAEHLAAAFPGAVPPDAPTPTPPSARPSRDLPGDGDRPAGREIAVIGMAGRFPGADSTDELWHALLSGRDLLREVPGERWDHRALLDPTGGGPARTRCARGGFLDRPDRFDAAFFGISPREAEVMDPQVRLVLEAMYEASENAAVTPRLRGSHTGTFVGLCFRDYDEIMTASGRAVGPHDATGNAASMVANRPAHALDLTGPSVTVDTACSSSLVAVHQAVSALRRGECAMAFAAGANLVLSPRHYLRLDSLGALSASGGCHSFAADADGYVPAEAVAAVLLKPLDAALRDGDPVLAVIRGSAVGHTGRTASVTAPAPRAQTRLLRAAWADADADPSTMTLLEAHGTGTVLGDPVETEAVRALLDGAAASGPGCHLGSAKAHLGHGEAAAGITGLVKAVLALRHRTVPAMPAFGDTNPYCRLDEGPLRINRASLPWEAPATAPRRAGVSSFGFGGTGAHVVLEEAPAPAAAPTTAAPYVVPVSARGDEALRRAVRALRAALDGEPAPALPEVASALAFGREAMPTRIAVLAGDLGELRAALDAFLSGRDHPALWQPVPADLPGAPPGGRPPEVAAARWASGADVDWSAVFPGGPTRRAALPGARLAPERHWFDGSLDAAPTGASEEEPPRQAAPGGGPDRHGGAERPPDETVFLTSTLVPGEPRRDGPAPVLAVVGGSPVLRDALRSHAARCGLPAPALAGHPGGLWAEVRGPGPRPSVVVLLEEEPPPTGPERPADPRSALDAALERAAALVTGWSRDADREPLVVISARRGAPEPAHQALTGFGRSAVSWDHELGWCTLSDDGTGGDTDAFAARVWAEARGTRPGDVAEVDYHGGQRRTRERRPLTVADAEGRAAFRDGGRYLVTGGLGGIGRALGRELARSHGARLLLTGRSALDEAGRAHLAELEHLGGEAVYVQSDSTSPRRTAAAVAFARSRFGGLDGVLHLAGVLRERVIPERVPEVTAAVLDPKVAGSLVLDEATREEDLDLFLLMSSMAAVEGGPALADYATANGFLDAFAERRARRVADGERRGLTLAVNFPYWADGGLVMPPDTATRIERATGVRPFTTASGLAALTTAVRLARGTGAARVITADGDAHRVRTRLTGAAPRPAPHDPGPAHRAPHDRDTPGGRDTGQSGRPGGREAVRDELLTLIAGILQLRQPPRPADDLRELGFESVTVQELAHAVRERFGVRLRASEFYEYRTADALADRLLAAPPEAAAPPPAEPGTAPRPRDTPPAAPTAHEEPLAIVGLSGVFPGSPDLSAFWRNLVEGRDLVTTYPGDRLPWPGDTPPPQGGFLDRIDLFDPDFFGLSPREAELTDPQQRLLLMTAHRALDDAALPPAALAGTATGVFVGVSNVDYADVLRVTGRETAGHAITGLAHGMVANRLSYLLDLHGPSESVDTACSSSLVALHRAARALRAGECSTALVGGVNVLASPGPFQACANAGMLSPTGRCRTFDRRADGYVRGEGAGVVVLRRLDEALADGDPVRAVLRGTGVSHAGHAHGLTVPDPVRQAELLTAVYARSGIDPATIGYVETHGTGTALGDPIEINGLRRAFATVPDGARCGLGTVKTNIGHLESASGIAGLIKTVLALRDRTLPASLHCAEPNPEIDLTGTPFHLVRQTGPWLPPRRGGEAGPLRAGVSSFGFGGVNAHVVLEEWPTDGAPAGPLADGPVPVLLSAPSDGQLSAYARDLATHLAASPAPRLADTAHTLAARAPGPHRFAVLGHATGEVAAALRAFADDRRAAPLGDGPLAGAARAWLERGGPIPPELRPAGRRVPLPGVPFRLRRCWPGTPVNPPAPGGAAPPGAEAAEAPEAPRPATAPAPADADALRLQLRRLFADYLGLPVEEVDPSATYDRYRLDSVGAVELGGLLIARFGPLPRTLLYECGTIDALTTRLLTDHPGPVIPPPDAGPAPGPPSEPAPDTARRAASPAPEPPRGADGAEPVAIVGFAGTFPGSPDADALWRHLENGDDLITEIPAERFDWRAIHGDPLTRPGRTNSRWGGFVPDVAAFDAALFGITPAEAELTDPQQRLFLQASCAAVEHAGHALSSLRGSRTGVFAGVSAFDYHEVLVRAGRQEEAHAPSGVSHAVLTNRVSYLLDLRGPSEPVDTACSSSLTALHRAVRCLQAGDCAAAIAGGVNLLLTSELFVAFGQGGFLSPDGRCRSFGAGANGYVRGEGAAAVYLKPLSAALADGDTVHAVIRGSGVNHGGRVRSLTVPNPNAQTDLVTEVHRRAGVAPGSVTYVETHGTGTSLGDPIEVEALKRAFAPPGGGDASGRSPGPWCGIGSVKSNIGHLESAAGMAGLVKVLLALRHGTLPPTLHARERNPLLELDGSPFFVVDRAVPWTRRVDETGRETPRRAGLSSFGFGGSNGHVLLEEHRAAPLAPVNGRPPQLLVLSARTRERLAAYVVALESRLTEAEEGLRLVDVAFTLQTGRDAREVRLALVAGDIAEAVGLLRAYRAAPDTEHAGLWHGTPDATAHATADPTAGPPPVDDLPAWARWWVRGGSPPWRLLHDGPRRRVPLPSYPFAPTRYWAEPPATGAPEPETAPPPDDDERAIEVLAGLRDGRVSVEEAERLLSTTAPTHEGGPR